MSIEIKFEAGWSLAILRDEKTIYSVDDATTYPVFSPDKSKLVFLQPFGFEIPSSVYLLDLNDNSCKLLYSHPTVRVNNLDYPEKTVKEVVWINDKQLGLIVGGTYGTVSWGGEIYVLDISTAEARLSLSPSEGAFEIYGLTTDERYLFFTERIALDSKYNEFSERKARILKSELLASSPILTTH